MPTGQTPTPAYKRGADLPYGAAGSANAAIPNEPGAEPSPLEQFITDQGETPEDQFKPGTPQEQYLFGGTDRPGEPITSGAPFGPGPNMMRDAFETDRQYIDRLSAQLAAAPNAAPDVKAFAALRARGL